MKVRTGDDHEFTPEQANVDQFTVKPLPSIDYATKALLDAQSKYFNQYPDARKHSRALIWDIDIATPEKERTVKVTLTADASAFEEAMTRATGAASGLTEMLRKMGVADADLPEAVRAVLKFTRKDGKPGPQ